MHAISLQKNLENLHSINNYCTFAP